MEMMATLKPDAMDWRKLDCNSHRKLQLPFEIGTFIHVWSEHDGHDYGTNNYALIAAYTEKRDHTLQFMTRMRALRQDGTVGNNLRLYNPFWPHFEPEENEEQLDKFLYDLPDNLEVRARLQIIEDMYNE